MTKVTQSNGPDALFESAGARCLLILGMHRSGTSALGGVINAFGLYLGEDLEEAKEENPKGFFEHKRVMTLNEDILRLLGSSWDDPCPLPVHWEDAPALAPLYAAAEDFVRTEFAGCGSFAIKDPRICVLFPFWERIFHRLHIAVDCILCYRSVTEVAGSLRKRNGFSQEKSACLWFKHMLAAEFYSRKHARCMVGFDQLLSSPGDVAAMLQKTFPALFTRPLDEVQAVLKGFLDKGLRHQQSTSEVPSGFPGYLGEAAQAFCRAAESGKLEADEFDGLRGIFEQNSIFFLNKDIAYDLQTARTQDNALEYTRNRLAETEEYIRAYSAWIRRADRVRRVRAKVVARLPGKMRTLLSCWRERGLGWTFRHTLKKILPQSAVDLGKFYKAKWEHKELAEKLKTAKQVIVCFPIIDWDFRWQRPQQLMTRLARQGAVVLYPTMLPAPTGEAMASSRQAVGHVQVQPLAENVFSVCLPSKDGFNPYSDVMQPDDLMTMQSGLEGLLALGQVKNPVYMVQFPGWAPLAFRQKQVRPGRIVFDLMDEHSGFTSNADGALADEASLIKRADLVLATSDRLYDKAKQENNGTVMVRNAGEFEHFHGARSNGELAVFGNKPIIGYYGAISDWFDMDLLVECAAKRPDWNFVLIGSTDGADISTAVKFSNIHFLGEKPYAELPGFLADFDVCIIPFKLIPLTLATNPVKFYEFMSAGKPVVSVRLPELEQYGGHCFLADTSEEFLELVEKALQSDSDKEMRNRIELGRVNSWDQRALTIMEALGE